MLSDMYVVVCFAPCACVGLLSVSVHWQFLTKLYTLHFIGTWVLASLLFQVRFYYIDIADLKTCSEIAQVQYYVFFLFGRYVVKRYDIRYRNPKRDDRLRA